MFEKLKQFKDLRDKAKVIQETLSAERVQGTGAWGKVTIDIDGNQNVLAVSIDDSMLAPSEKNKLQDGVKEAVNDAVKKVQKKVFEKMKDMGGLNLPGM